MATGNDWDDEDDDGVPNEQESTAKPKGGLRAYAETLKREAEQLRRQVEEFQAGERKRNTEGAIKTRGFDPKVAALIPKDVAGNADELNKWLDSHAGLFKASKTATKTGDEGERADEEDDMDQVTDDPDDDSLRDDEGAWGRMSRVSSSSLPTSKRADTLSAINNAKTREEFNAVLKKFGNTNV